MRIIKKHDERKNEILDTAENLFIKKGYEVSTIKDILKKVGIAKGTFYHYFNSKEEVLDAVVLRFTDIISNRAKKVLEKSNSTPEEKLMNIFLAMRINDKIDSNLLNELHKIENALLHKKILNQVVTAMAPVLSKVIEEGIEKKIWRCKYPLQHMQIFLVASLNITDEGIFELDADSNMKVFTVLISILEKMLDAPKDSFKQLFIQNYGSNAKH